MLSWSWLVAHHLQTSPSTSTEFGPEMTSSATESPGRTQQLEKRSPECAVIVYNADTACSPAESTLSSACKPFPAHTTPEITQRALRTQLQVPCPCSSFFDCGWAPLGVTSRWEGVGTGGVPEMALTTLTFECFLEHLPGAATSGCRMRPDTDQHTCAGAWRASHHAAASCRGAEPCAYNWRHNSPSSLTTPGERRRHRA